MTERTNEEWLGLLASPGPAGEGAVAELRGVIRRGLHKALRGRHGTDDAFVDDMSQEAILKVLGGMTGFRGDSKLTTWAVAVAVRVAFSELRRARWRDVSLDDLTEGGLAPPEAEDSASRGVEPEQDEVIGVMRRVIDTELTERQRFVLAAELNLVPQAEICARLGVNRNALYKLSHDARQKLKRGLLASGLTEDGVREIFGISSKK